MDAHESLPSSLAPEGATGARVRDAPPVANKPKKMLRRDPVTGHLAYVSVAAPAPAPACNSKETSTADVVKLEDDATATSEERASRR